MEIFCISLYLNITFRCNAIDQNKRTTGIFTLSNELNFIVSFIEIIALCFFALCNVRLDFPDFHIYCFQIWVYCNAFQMILRPIISLHLSLSSVDKLNFGIKLMATIIFYSWIAIFYDSYMNFAEKPACHSFVHFYEAIAEYMVLLSYLLMNTSNIIDLRHIRLVIYPPTYSGQCEMKLDPINYGKGGRYKTTFGPKIL